MKRNFIHEKLLENFQFLELKILEKEKQIALVKKKS
jgi:hypothetical protein